MSETRNKRGWFSLVLVMPATLLIGLASPVSAAAEPVNAEQASPRAAARIVTMVQRNTARFLDAHEIASLDFQSVTRPQQNNDSQLWQIVDA